MGLLQPGVLALDLRLCSVLVDVATLAKVQVRPATGANCYLSDPERRACPHACPLPIDGCVCMEGEVKQQRKQLRLRMYWLRQRLLQPHLEYRPYKQREDGRGQLFDVARQHHPVQ